MANEEMVELQQEAPLADVEVPATEGKVTQQEVHQPEDIAAAFFKLNQAKLERQLSNLSSKQLRRVIFNACSYPFVDKEYKPRTEEEKQVAYVIHELMLNKTIMTLSFEMQEAEKALKKQETEVQLENKSEGDNNG